MISYGIDWDRRKAAIREKPWAQAIYGKIKAEADKYVDCYRDEPERISGWGHNYSCAKCSSRLEYHVDSPRIHICPECGFKNTADKVNWAWNAAYRDRVHKSAFYAAIVYRINGDRKYVEFIRKVLQFYCEHYESLQVDVPHERFRGKIAGIHLGDAVGLVTLLNAMEILREEWTVTEKEYYKEKLFIPEVNMFLDFSERMGIFNINCWLKSAIGMAGAFFNDTDMAGHAVEGPYGIRAQLEKGVTSEGFWFEGSFTYHFYCLQGLTQYLYLKKIYSPEEEDTKYLQQVLEKMYILPLDMAFENGYLPNPNDGWPRIHLRSFIGQYTYIHRITENPRFSEALMRYSPWKDEKLETSDSEAIDTLENEVPYLLFAEENEVIPVDSAISNEVPGSLNLEGTGFCMLRSKGMEVFLKYGLHTPSHAHPDIMNIEISALGDVISYDLSTNGYGSFLYAEWQRFSISHNTVLIDQENQVSRGPGETMHFDGRENRIRALARGVYPGVDYVRELRLLNLRLLDSFEVYSKDEHIMDWVFYCKGDISYDFNASDSRKPGHDNGYQHMLDCRVFRTNGQWSVCWVLDGHILELTMEGVPDTEVYIFNSYEDTINHTRYGLLVRRKGKGTVYKANYFLKCP